MAINISRFYRRERLKLECEIITPMFLGNANQEAELRAGPFKGLLRYWWRVANGCFYKTEEEMLFHENRIFGSSDASQGGKSQVTLEVKEIADIVPQKKEFRSLGTVFHPECERTNYRISPLGYLAGIGLIHFKKGVQHSYFPPGARFECSVTVNGQVLDEVKDILGLWSKFGAIGSRCRNGWGSFMVKWPYSFRPSVQKIDQAFNRDYPHCLAEDQKGHLCWKTKRRRGSWEEAMKDLAEIYVSIRVGNKKKNIKGLDVVHGPLPERHLLGYPVTNHHLNLPHWGKNGRHGSALRLIVRKEGDQFRGYILHLPHLFSKRMWKDEKERQVEIWRKVHHSLDSLCERVKYQEVGQ